MTNGSTSASASRVVAISSDKLIVDERYQARDRLDPQHIERLRNSDPKTWPPLLVTPHKERTGFFLIIDGCHRFEAGKRLGDGRRVTQFPCIVRENLGYAASFEANRSHPLTLSTSERKLFARWLHQARPDLSVRAIAREVGITHPTVLAAIAEESPRAARSVGIPRLLGILRRSLDSAEGAGMFGLGNREPKYIAACILDSRDPQGILRALDFWLPRLSEGLEIAREKESKPQE